MNILKYFLLIIATTTCQNSILAQNSYDTSRNSIKDNYLASNRTTDRKYGEWLNNDTDNKNETIIFNQDEKGFQFGIQNQLTNQQGMVLSHLGEKNL